jgi:phage N-6-adenine-methyltransferase
MIAPALLSSTTDEWATPPDLFGRLSRWFGPFDLDVCATVENAKCPRYFTREVDGLQQEWAGRCWMNPPYGRAVGKWVRKAWESSGSGAIVVCLLPARPDTRWWQEYVIPYAATVDFLPGRVRFGGATSGAPFPSAVVVFHPQAEAACGHCGGLYVPRRSDSRYCSGACRQAAYRERVTVLAVTQRSETRSERP